MNSLSIVIPAFNEELRLLDTLSAIADYTRQQSHATEILVVDDGSADRTAELVRRFARSCPTVRLIQNGRNRGKGYSIRCGVQNASGEIILIMDADLPAPIQQSQRLIDGLSAGAEIAIGSRALNGVQRLNAPIHRRIGSRLFRALVRVLFHLNYQDTQCGFKALTREAANKIFASASIERWAFDVEMLLLAQRLNYRVAEIAVEAFHRQGSKINFLRDSIGIASDLMTLLRNFYKHPRQGRSHEVTRLQTEKG